MPDVGLVNELGRQGAEYYSGYSNTAPSVSSGGGDEGGSAPSGGSAPYSESAFGNASIVSQSVVPFWKPQITIPYGVGYMSTNPYRWWGSGEGETQTNVSAWQKAERDRMAWQSAPLSIMSSLSNALIRFAPPINNSTDWRQRQEYFPYKGPAVVSSNGAGNVNFSVNRTASPEGGAGYGWQAPQSNRYPTQQNRSAGSANVPGYNPATRAWTGPSLEGGLLGYGNRASQTTPVPQPTFPKEDQFTSLKAMADQKYPNGRRVYEPYFGASDAGAANQEYANRRDKFFTDFKDVEAARKDLLNIRDKYGRLIIADGSPVRSFLSDPQKYQGKETQVMDLYRQVVLNDQPKVSKTLAYAPTSNKNNSGRKLPLPKLSSGGGGGRGGGRRSSSSASDNSPSWYLDMLTWRV